MTEQRRFSFRTFGLCVADFELTNQRLRPERAKVGPSCRSSFSGKAKQGA